MKYVRRGDSGPAIPDDMPPHVRAFLFLVEHASWRRDLDLPVPCTCQECEHHRGAVRYRSLGGGRLRIEPAP